jgi:lipid-binding SYLF domain-containing protein
MKRFVLPVLVLSFVGVAPVKAAPPPAQTLKNATEVLDELAAIPLKGIPPALLADAQGVVIVPHVIKAGFIFGGQGGHGVIMTRDKNGVWSEPVFANLGGASVGLQDARADHGR